MARWIGIALLLALVMLSGCSGCRRQSQGDKTPEEIEKESLDRHKKEAERVKPDFEANRLVSRPPVGQSVAGCGIKPGHWTCVALEDAKTNHFDFVGEFELSVTDKEGRLLPTNCTLFEMAVCRDMALAKGKVKSLESLLFVPPSEKVASATYRFNAGQGGRQVVDFPREPLMGLMPSWQYHLVVLARKPEPYAYLQRLPCVRPPSSLDAETPAASYYHVALLETDRRTRLPAHAEQWTSIACVLWDDASPDALDAAQQQAMLDWLHWGGQLILSGPNTLDTLRNSFLAPYLPALAAGSTKLGKNELAALNAFSHKAIRPLAPARPWSGVRFKIHPQADFVPDAGEMLVERRVGRGRIVASAFRLSDREFSEWPGCDETFNAMLLRRPPRRYDEDADGESQLRWADNSPQFDARRTTAVRYFSRDTGVPFSEYARDATAVNIDPNRSFSGYRLPSNPSPIDPPTAPGAAAWNDFNPVARAARETLQKAAQIEIPRREFVAWVVAVYLLILVPANWLVFRSIRRVEWAWIAAPLIAVVCTVVVIRLAQLDIGFARSQTETTVVEIQADYPRAHVARYNALYTSLATNYELTGDDPGAAILPFPTVAEPNLFRTSLGQQMRRLTCRRGEHVAVSGFYVGSNSTGLLHSEEMLDLGGVISLAENDDATCNLVNRSTLNLHGVGLLRKTRDGDLQEAWIGELPIAKPTNGFRWTTISNGDADKLLWHSQREQSPLSASKPPPGTLNLRTLLDLGQDVKTLDAGEVRLIGWSNDDLPGLAIKPAAPQIKRGILVIAHLGYGPGEVPRPDVNLRNTSTP